MQRVYNQINHYSLLDQSFNKKLSIFWGGGGSEDNAVTSLGGNYRTIEN